MERKNRKYTNNEITVYWKPRKCIHATTCYKELIEVFNPARRPWVNMDGATTEKIIEVVDKCPTQALSWEYNNKSDQKRAKQQKEKADNAESFTKIQVMKDGPIVVEGDFKIINHDCTEIKNMMMTSFCRCGFSNNMPFCDGSHRKHGFSDRNKTDYYG